MTCGRYSGLLAMLLGVWACSSSDTNSSSSDPAGNACQSDEDCGADGRCVASFCEATDNGLGQLLLEVVPPSGVTSGEYAQVRYIRPLHLGVAGSFDIALDVVAELAVAVSPPTDACAPAGLDSSGNLPIRVTAFEASRINGLGTPAIDGESEPSKRASAQGNTVTLFVAPGTVDLYIEPITGLGSNVQTVEPSGECDLAPILALGQTIAPGRVSLVQRLAVAEHLELDVRAPALDGWTIDLVEPIEGRRLSNRVVLNTPVSDSDGSTHYPVRLAYHAVIGSGADKVAGTELLRLSPPTGTLAPTFYVARSALDLFGTGQLLMSQVRDIPKPVTVKGLVESELDGTPIRADVVVRLESSEGGANGALAQFQATTSTDEAGRFEFALVDGNYEYVAIPVDATHYASRVGSWAVAPSPVVQAGKLIQIGPLSTVTGVVYSASNEAPIADATLVAQPSSIGKRPTFLDELLGAGRPIGVRTQMVVADAAGTFQLPVDAGRYDVGVRPAEGSGYPWAIRPSFDVEAGAKGLSIAVRNPVTHGGFVTVPGRGIDTAPIPIPGALLRFFALFDQEGQLADGIDSAISAVEIGQTRTGVDGSYRLLLPDRID